jgi:hypothetical protein
VCQPDGAAYLQRLSHAVRGCDGQRPVVVAVRQENAFGDFAVDAGPLDVQLTACGVAVPGVDDLAGRLAAVGRGRAVRFRPLLARLSGNHPGIVLDR